MMIVGITYKRTINLGNYENFTIELAAEPDDLEHPDDAMDALRAYMELEISRTRADILGRQAIPINRK